MEYASKGLAGTALGFGIGGAALGLANGGLGNLLSGCCCCVNHTFTLVATTDSTAAGSVIELCTGLLKLA